MQNSLVLETTLGGLAVALQRADGAVFCRHTNAPRSSSQLHPMLAETLAEAGLQPAQIGTLAVTVGPGSFTGARVAVAVAEAWGLACPGCRCVGLDTLGVLAKEVIEKGKGKKEKGTGGFRVLLDAAGGMAYAQDFDAHGQPQSAATCVPLAEATTTALPVFTAGLPLLEGAAHLGQMSPQALLTALADTAAHRPLAAVYLKPLAYREKAPR